VIKVELNSVALSGGVNHLIFMKLDSWIKVNG